METILQDLQYGLRRLAASPGFTAAAVLSLALGIGANTAIFTLIDAVLLRGLPVEELDRLVRLYSTDEIATAATGRSYFPVSYPNFDDLRRQADSFSAAALFVWMPFNLGGEQGPPERVFGQMVSGNYFDVLRVKAAIGRTFLPEEDGAPGAHPVVVLSDALWKRRFGADPELVGKTVQLNGIVFTVVGVAPRGFRGVETIGACDLWVPMAMRGQIFAFNQFFDQRRWRLFEAVARLAPGVDPDRARASLQVVNRRLQSEYPAENEKRGFFLLPLAEAAVDVNQRETFTRAGGLLMGTAGLVLLIACANVASLLLARATRRRKEIAVRLSLGATRPRLLRQLLTESLLLALLAGVLGLLIAVWMRNLLWSLRPPFLTAEAIDLGLHPRILLVSLAVSILCGLLFGIAPAWRASRPGVVDDLKDQVGLPAAGRRFGLRQALVVLQVAVSLVALIGAGLFLRSLRNAQAVDLGFSAENLLASGIDLAAQRYDEPRGRNLQSRLLENLEALPGIESATLAQARPMAPEMVRSLVAEGVEMPEGGLVIGINSVGPKFFETMRLPLLEGRGFEASDRPESVPVAVVSETLAKRLWPAGGAIGRTVMFQGENVPIQIVGVVRGSRYRNPTEEPQPYIFLPLSQRYSPLVDLLVRTRGSHSAGFESIRRTLAGLDPNLPMLFPESVEDSIANSQWGPRMIAGLLTGFGALALVLATVGLYATLAHSVHQRTREIGIRSALGARRGHMLRLILGQALSFVGLGLAIGLAAAYLGSRVAASLLFGVSATDPTTFMAVSLLLALVALLASVIPASRAARVQPLRALRYE
jgi:putative ABC transport system permease protein